MEEYKCDSWSDFFSKVELLKSKHGNFVLGGKKYPVRILYRGQADSSWPLTTTLERMSSNKYKTISDYTRLVCKVAPKAAIMSGRTFELSDPSKHDKEVRQGEIEGISPFVLGYPLWVYLRHHGFPSPLLDWTLSPFIAAFFALEQDLQNIESAAIYAYIEFPEGAKSYLGDETIVTTMTHEVEAHPRHFLQQCQYTLAHRYESGLLHFHEHREVFEKSAGDQDVLLRIVIPRQLRQEALKSLNELNINHFSLMQSEDALMKTLSLEYFE
jgi:hypothetical protein